MANKNLMTTGLVALAALVVGGVGGYYFRDSQLTQMRRNFAGGAGNFQRFVAGGGQGQGGAAGSIMRGGVFGSVLSIDDKTLTVKLADGSSKIVLFSDATKYENTIEAKLTDVKVGENVAVMGSSNSDGSVTAASIQINPQFGRMISSPTPTTQK